MKRTTAPHNVDNKHVDELRNEETQVIIQRGTFGIAEDRNNIQEEICNFIEGSGLVLNGDNQSQLKEASDIYIENAIAPIIAVNDAQDTSISVIETKLGAIASLTAVKTFPTPLSIPLSDTNLSFAMPNIIIIQEGTNIELSPNDSNKNIIKIINTSNEVAWAKIGLTAEVGHTSPTSTDLFLSIWEAVSDNTTTGGTKIKEKKLTLNGNSGATSARRFDFAYSIPASTNKYIYFSQRASQVGALAENEAFLDITGKILAGTGATVFADLQNDTVATGSNGKEVIDNLVARIVALENALVSNKNKEVK